MQQAMTEGQQEGGYVLTKSPLFTLLLSAAAAGLTRDDEDDWNQYGYAACTTAAGTSARQRAGSPLVRLSNGGRLTRRLDVVYAGALPHVAQFDPVLKQLAQYRLFPVFPHTDGQGIRPFLKHYRCHRR